MTDTNSNAQRLGKLIGSRSDLFKLEKDNSTFENVLRRLEESEGLASAKAFRGIVEARAKSPKGGERVARKVVRAKKVVTTPFFEKFAANILYLQILFTLTTVTTTLNVLAYSEKFSYAWWTAFAGSHCAFGVQQVVGQVFQSRDEQMTYRINYACICISSCALIGSWAILLGGDEFFKAILSYLQ